MAGVFRTHRKTNFTTVPNTILQDKELSLKAKGLLCAVFSLPDEWEYSEIGLASIFKEGRDAIRSTIEELENAGYVVRKKTRRPDGKWNCDYEWYEQPCRKNRVGKTDTENPTVIKEINKRNKENNNTINSIIVHSDDKPVKTNEKIAYCFNHWQKVMGVKMKSSKLNGISCKRLIEFCGGDEGQLCRVIDALPQMMKEQGRYAVRVADFVELEKKWNKIMDWGRRKMIETQKQKEDEEQLKDYKPF